MTLQYVINLEWVPPAEVRGNTRAHWGAKARKASELKESGFWHGEELMQAHRADQWPLRDILSIEITCWTQRDIADGDNMLIGYKAFIDGLQQSGMIHNDRSIKDWTIHMRRGKPARSRIVIARTE